MSSPMFRIRRIYDDVLPRNRSAIREVQQILVAQFPGAPAKDAEGLPERLRDPFRFAFRSILFVAENAKGHVCGFALLLHDPALAFCYLDYIANAPGTRARGIGAALYERVRGESLALGATALLFECLPDDADRCPDPVLRKQNGARLRFYESYGALPIVGTAYETAVPGGSDRNLPHLMYDALDRGKGLGVALARRAVRAILERKYAHLCDEAYIRKVVASFRDDPVRLRPPRYSPARKAHPPAATRTPEKIPVTVNDKHDIHHIQERGYVEAPARIRAILGELMPTGRFELVPVREYPLRHIRAVHDAELVQYIERACAGTPPGKSVYPYVFPIRNVARPPKELSIRAGYYCIDTFTPINRNAFPAAKRGVDCVLSAADLLLAGRRLAYALVRPPGHHAERRSFGGFCYFCNAAVAAHYFSGHGKVAILDLDYHHGNGQQDIFYERDDVLTVSIHGDPAFAYPYFTGFADERGAGKGEGFNVNLPLPEIQNGDQYARTLAKAIRIVREFGPAFLIVALGLDPAKGDPTGTWTLTARDFERNGRMLRELNLPTLVVQEGGYRTRTLGTNVRHFFEGLSAEPGA